MGKHKKKNGKFIYFSILIIIILAIVCISIMKLIEMQMPKHTAETSESTEEQEELEIVKPEKEDTIVTVDFPEKLGEYDIIGKIIIPKISLEKNILNKTDKKTLDTSVTWFWGPNADEPSVNVSGNVSIIGHNNSDFQRLDELEIGDEFSLISKDGRKVEYQIYDSFTVAPNNVSCIEQDGSDRREITLITCTRGGLNRLIFKGRELP